MTDIATAPLQRTELPPSRVGAVKPPLSLADRSGEIGLATATARFAGERYNNVVKAKAANEHAEFQGIAAAEIEGFDTYLVSKPGRSFKETETERNAMVARIEVAANASTTELAQQDNKKWMLRNKGRINAQTQTSMEAIRTRQALATFNVQRKNLITNFKDDELADLYAGQVASQLMTQKFADAQQARDVEIMKEAEKKVMVENIKPLLIDAVEAGDKADGIELLNKATDQLVSDGILTEAEGAQANKSLGDWVDNYVAGRQKRAEDEVELTTFESYDTLSEKIVSSTLSFDDIEQSELSKADKEKWQTYITGSYQDATTENTPAGLLGSVGAVFDAASLQKSPTDAYDDLLNERFVKRTITDEQFLWGIDKIKNPYPKPIMEDLRATLNANNENFNRLFQRDKERNKRVNEALIVWVDELIKQDKVPLFDFKKKMYAMSSQFRVGNDRWYDIGTTIERGGRNWEVIGFDENGEPLVEEIQ